MDPGMADSGFAYSLQASVEQVQYLTLFLSLRLIPVPSGLHEIMHTHGTLNSQLTKLKVSVLIIQIALSLLPSVSLAYIVQRITMIL